MMWILTSIASVDQPAHRKIEACFTATLVCSVWFAVILIKNPSENRHKFIYLSIISSKNSQSCNNSIFLNITMYFQLHFENLFIFLNNEVKHFKASLNLVTKLLLPNLICLPLRNSKVASFAKVLFIGNGRFVTKFREALTWWLFCPIIKQQ